MTDNNTTSAATTTVDEIADGIHRISTYQAEGPPGGITFNQFVVTGDEPLLFHTGTRHLFPVVHDAVATVVDPASIRWISSGHASRPDEFGSLAEWESVAPASTVVHGRTGCFLCLSDLSARPLRTVADGDTITVGDHRLQWLDTPHVPGPWEAGVIYDETTGTLFCGDLFSRTGPAPATTTDSIADAAIAHDQLMHGHAYTPNTGPTLRRLAATATRTPGADARPDLRRRRGPRARHPRRLLRQPPRHDRLTRVTRLTRRARCRRDARRRGAENHRIITSALSATTTMVVGTPRLWRARPACTMGRDPNAPRLHCAVGHRQPGTPIGLWRSRARRPALRTTSRHRRRRTRRGARS